MKGVSRSLDDLDRVAFRLTRTVRTQFPQLCTQGFTLGDLEKHLLPFPDVRREMADSSRQAFEIVMLRLVSGERGYVTADRELQHASRHALGAPVPSLSLIGEWATASLHLSDPDSAGPSSSEAPEMTDTEIFPVLAPSLSPTRGSKAIHAWCRYCDGQLPDKCDTKFCPHCGIDQTARQCPACSTELKEGWSFCVTCGRRY